MENQIRMLIIEIERKLEELKELVEQQENERAAHTKRNKSKKQRLYDARVRAQDWARKELSRSRMSCPLFRGASNNRGNNTLLNQAEERTPLKLLTDFNPDKLTTVKLEQYFNNDTKKKVDAPTHSMELLEMVLYCLNEFLEIADRFLYNAEDKFANYCLTLKNHARATWTIMARQDRDHSSKEEFDACVKEFLSTIATHDSFKHLQKYLMLAIKPRSMTPKEVVNCIRVLSMYAAQLPGAPVNPWLELQLKRMVLHAMPHLWQNDLLSRHVAA